MAILTQNPNEPNGSALDARLISDTIDTAIDANQRSQSAEQTATGIMDNVNQIVQNVTDDLSGIVNAAQAAASDALSAAQNAEQSASTTEQMAQELREAADEVIASAALQKPFGGTLDASTGVLTLTRSGRTIMDTMDPTITLTADDDTNTGYMSNVQSLTLIVSVSGEFGNLGLIEGDEIIATDSGWIRVPRADAVGGVKGNEEATFRTGLVNLRPEDVLTQGQLDVLSGSVPERLGTNDLGANSISELSSLPASTGHYRTGWNRFFSSAMTGIPNLSGEGQLMTMGNAQVAVVRQGGRVRTFIRRVDSNGPNTTNWVRLADEQDLAIPAPITLINQTTNFTGGNATLVVTQFGQTCYTRVVINATGAIANNVNIGSFPSSFLGALMNAGIIGNTYVGIGYTGSAIVNNIQGLRIGGSGQMNYMRGGTVVGGNVIEFNFQFRAS